VKLTQHSHNLVNETKWEDIMPTSFLGFLDILRHLLGSSSLSDESEMDSTMMLLMIDVQESVQKESAKNNFKGRLKH
jgi:hypothetical protein